MGWEIAWLNCEIDSGHHSESFVGGFVMVMFTAQPICRPSQRAFGRSGRFPPLRPIPTLASLRRHCRLHEGPLPADLAANQTRLLTRPSNLPTNLTTTWIYKMQDGAVIAFTWSAPCRTKM